MAPEQNTTSPAETKCCDAATPRVLMSGCSVAAPLSSEAQATRAYYTAEIRATKSARVELDNALQSVKKLGGSEECNEAIKKTKEAIMWLGLNLKRLGAANPYPNSYDASNSVVEPTADGVKL